MPAKTPAEAEGDTNLSPRRRGWIETQLDAATRELVKRDARVFLQQSVSTPCLSAVAHAEGIWIEDLEGRRHMDFHGNNVHHIGYAHPRLVGDQAADGRADLRAAPLYLRRPSSWPRSWWTSPRMGWRGSCSRRAGPTRSRCAGVCPSRHGAVQDDLVLGLVSRIGLRSPQRRRRGHVPRRADRAAAERGGARSPIRRLSQRMGRDRGSAARRAHDPLRAGEGGGCRRRDRRTGPRRAVFRRMGSGSRCAGLATSLALS